MVRSVLIALLLGGSLTPLASASAGEPATGSPPIRKPEEHGRGRRSPAIPPSLERLESAAEDIGDAAAARSWSKAGKLVGSAERDLAALGQSEHGGDLTQAQNHLGETRKAVESRQSLDAQFAANALSADVAALFAAYQPVVPVEVMRLDVLLRRVQLEGLAKKPEKAAGLLSEARRLWTGLDGAPPLKGTPAARRFESELAAVEAAASVGNPASLEKAAGVALEGIDGLERVFAPTNK